MDTQNLGRLPTERLRCAPSSEILLGSSEECSWATKCEVSIIQFQSRRGMGPYLVTRIIENIQIWTRVTDSLPPHHTGGGVAHLVTRVSYNDVHEWCVWLLLRFLGPCCRCSTRSTRASTKRSLEGTEAQRRGLGTTPDFSIWIQSVGVVQCE